MVILFDPIFGHGKMIVFPIVEWIQRAETAISRIREKIDRAFPMPAIPTRHEVTRKPKGNNYSFFQDLKIKHQSI